MSAPQLVARLEQDARFRQLVERLSEGASASAGNLWVSAEVIASQGPCTRPSSPASSIAWAEPHRFPA
ncbi:MAG: hypothetical protein AAFZ65_02180, partial [Planctomycetota bacterium]